VTGGIAGVSLKIVSFSESLPMFMSTILSGWIERL